MLNSDKPYTFDRVIRLALTAGILWGLVLLLDHLSEVLIPFFVAFLMAYLLNPLVNQVQRILRSRPLAVFLTLITTLLIFVGSLMVVTPMITKELTQMGQLVGKILESSDYAEKVADYLPEDVWLAVKEFAKDEQVQGFLKKDGVLKTSTQFASKFFPKALGVLKGTANLLIGLLGLSVILLYLIFLLMDYEAVRKDWKNLLPQAWRQPVVDFVADFDLIMNRHFRAQALVALLVGILFSIAFGLLGLPLGILLGLAIGAMNMVPYLQVLGIPPALFLALMKAVETNQSVGVLMALTLGAFVVIQLIQDALLTPRIMGEVTGLRPAVILLSISIWGKLLGLLGLIIALPATCLFLAYYRRIVLNPKIKNTS